MESQAVHSTHSLRKYAQLIFLFKSLLSLMLIIIFSVLVASWSFPICLVPQCLLGIFFVHMVELQHEALHGATEWRSLNRLIGILLGWPMLISYSDYQYHHMLHHEWVGTEQDTEYFSYSPDKSRSLRDFMMSFLMVAHYKKIATRMFYVLTGKLDIAQGSIRAKIVQEYWLFIVSLMAIIGVSLCLDNFIFLHIWILPLVLVSAPLHFLIELPEHLFCERNSRDVFRNTRTIKTHWLMNWFVNGNNYHVEHHLYPNYPISCLSKIHREVHYKIVHLENSYLSFYLSFIKKILNKSKGVAVHASH